MICGYYTTNPPRHATMYMLICNTAFSWGPTNEVRKELKRLSTRLWGKGEIPRKLKRTNECLYV